jgi:hypothetical protein
MKTRHAQAFGAAVFTARPFVLGGFEVAPFRAGAGIQQYADQGQVDLRACAAGRRGRGQRLIELAQAVHPAGFKMPPAAVVPNAQVGVAGAGDFGDQRGGGAHGAVVDSEPGGFAAARALKQGAGAGADGGG